MEAKTLYETGAAALLFSLTLVFGGRIHPLRPFVRDHRTLVSFSAGATAAYVFVHLLPEMHGARRMLAESATVTLRYEGMAIYFLALVGFLVFYGLNHLRTQPEAGGKQTTRDVTAWRIQIWGFAAYVALMSYLLVHSMEGGITQIVLYAIAVALHLLGIDHSLRERHGEIYDRVGRYLLAAGCVLGWGVSLVLVLSASVLALLVAFISGSIIMNSLITELPTREDGRFLPFLAGGLIYGLILLPLG